MSTSQEETSRPNALTTLLNLSRAARHEADPDALAFMAVNDTHSLVPYRQAALWTAKDGVQAMSGVVQVEANAPYAQWLHASCMHWMQSLRQPSAVDATTLSPELGAQWAEWVPQHGLFLPLRNGLAPAAPLQGALLLTRAEAWTNHDLGLLGEWMDVWTHAWCARQQAKPWSLSRLHLDWLHAPNNGVWWMRRQVLWGLGVLFALVCPIRLTVLAPAELSAANPSVVRAPIDGVIGRIMVAPNAQVQAGQALFGFEDAPLQSRLEVARQAVTGALAEYRQASQLAVSDPKYKSQIALLDAKTEERKAEESFLEQQLRRSHVLAPQAGVVIFDDPSDWIGRPVVTGERVMRIASPEDVEVEAWLAVGDAIPLPEGSPVRLYLNASPLASLEAKLRYVSHDAQQRPDGTYAYHVRATLTDKSTLRIGLKGTAKLTGHWVPLVYWIVRRPWSMLRQTVGW